MSQLINSRTFGTNLNFSPIPVMLPYKSIRYLLLFLGFVLLASDLRAQENWTLSADHQGIKVYTRLVEHSRVKAVRVIGIIPATSSQLLAAILDIGSSGEWVYHSKRNLLLKQNSPLDLIYYSETEVPWPAENRDYVVHIEAEQNPQTKVITVNSPCVAGFVAEKKGIVRISHSVGNWVITPVAKGQVRAEYTLQVDPMGTIPAWLINMFATKGPMETFRDLKVHVQKEEYKKARFAGIAN